MKIETIDNLRVITPDSGMFLCNEKQHLIATIVYLGIEADENEWSEITEERKEELEALWYEDVTDDSMATDEDYQNALESLGVKFDE